MPDATLTCIDFWIKAGSKYERAGEEGLAHFLEHMLFKGGLNLKAGDFDREIESLGGSSNAATGFDDVHYYVLVPHDAVEIALEHLINLVLNPSFEPGEFRTEREVVLEEIAQNKDQPDEQIIKILLEMCWGNHPYGKPILGDKKSLLKMSPEDMEEFHQRRYNSNNFTIAIAGKIPNNLEKILNKRLAGPTLNLSAKQDQNEYLKNVYFNIERREIEVQRLESSRLIMAWPIPPAEEQVFLIGVDIATSLLAEGRRSRLIQHLREDLQIVESIEMDITLLEEGGLVLLEAYCRKDKLDNVENEIHIILKESIKSTINEEELKRAHQLVRNSHRFSIEASSNVASLIGSQALWERHQPLLKPLQYIEYWSTEKLQKTILSSLQPENASILIANPPNDK